MITMEFGVAIFPTHDAIRPGDVARLAEERGHESLFFPEHTHIPVEHSPYPGGGRCRTATSTRSTCSSR